MYRGFSVTISFCEGPAKGTILIRVLSLSLLAYPNAEGGLGAQTQTPFTLNRLVKEVGRLCENERAALVVPPGPSSHR